MIFLSSNLGAAKMCAIDSPQLGFSPALKDGGLSAQRSPSPRNTLPEPGRGAFKPPILEITALAVTPGPRWRDLVISAWPTPCLKRSDWKTKPEVVTEFAALLEEDYR